MSRHIIYLLTVALLAVAACAPSARPTQKPVPQTSMPVTTTVAPTAPAEAVVANATPARVGVPTVAPTFAPSPRNVQVKRDNTLSASALISTTGGTLSVQAADGTQFTFTFPKGALLKDTKVTLTPLTNVDGLPFSGGLVGGVQIAPEGLRLLEPATLTIESSKTIAAKGFETVAFAYHQNGEGMYLTRSDTQGNVLTLEVWHFSGAGAAQGTAAEIQTQLQEHVPASPEDALVQCVVEYLRQQRDAQQRSEKGTSDWWKNMVELSREYYNRFIAPQLPIALQDCAAGQEITSKALAWLHQVYLLSAEKEFQSEGALIQETVNQAIVNCYNKEYDQCLIDNDIKHRIAMMKNFHDAELRGIADRLDQTKIRKCPRPHYRVDAVMGVYSKVPLTGEVCALDKPFSLKVDGRNPSGGQYIGDITFMPTDESDGSWKHTATSCIPGVGCGEESGGSTYQLEGVADGKPVLKMNASTASSAFKGYVGVYDWPAWQIELQPATGACSAQ